MDHLVLIGSGIIIGLILAAPVGPVNLICIRRGLQFGPINGFISGLGAALGDGFFAAISAFGVTAVAKLIEGFSVPLQVGGGILMVAFGLNTYLSQPSTTKEPAAKACTQPVARDNNLPASLVRAMASTLALTVSNPATLFGVAALFAGLGGIAGEGTSYIDAAVVVGGVILGSALWWLILTAIIAVFHTRINARVMGIINQASGVAVGLFGLAVLGHLLWKLV